jgi:Ca2+-binding RTX toxin-like protein
MKGTPAIALALVGALLLAGSALSAIRVGDERDNRLVGTERSDDLRGLAGNDRLIARPGNDLLVGGPERDRLRGGRGEDLADYRDVEGVTVDLRRPASGPDRLASVESLGGSPQADALRGDRRQNFLDGQRGDDKLVGRGGADTIIAFEGNDHVRAGRKKDIVVANGGQLTFVACGPGRDTVSADRRDRIGKSCERKQF